MTIHYSNTKEDYIEINKFIIKHKLYKFMFSNKNTLYRFNVTHYSYYIRYLAFLYCLIGLLYTYIISKDLIYVSTYILPCLFTSLAGYLFIDNILAIRLSNSLNKMIKQKPHILEGKTITVRDDYLVLSNSLNEDTKFNLKDICEIVENEYNLYIFLNRYKDFQVIPYSAFESKNDKNQFLKKLG